LDKRRYISGKDELKKLDFGQTATLLANLGVIAGIVFLGFELSQNNDLLAAQARYNLIVQRADMNDTVGEPLILEAQHKYESGTELTPVERRAISNLVAKKVEMWEWQYGEYRAGMLELDQLPIANWKRQYHGEDSSPNPVRDHWESLKEVVSADFVEFMEENVVNER
jgi:hypothetical protein